jgi:hypothetical protein
MAILVVNVRGSLARTGQAGDQTAKRLEQEFTVLFGDGLVRQIV